MYRYAGIPLKFIMIAALPLSISTVAVAQQDAQSGQYQGVSRPPTDTINASPDVPETQPVLAKPSAAVLATPAAIPAQAPAPYQQPYQPAASAYAPGPPQQTLVVRPSYDPSTDPDGDIVRPRVARPGELLEGATIRVKLLDRLSTVDSEKGEPFRGQVAYDVLQNGRVLIPAGSGIDGRITAVSSGHFGGHGSMRLKPEAVTLPDGTRYQLHAETTGTQGSKTRIGSEGTIKPGSRVKKDSIEYGAVVGTGAVTGAILGGPVGALTGSLIGAGIVTTHLMVDHPQATLEPGSMILFTLTEPMNLSPITN